MPEVVAEAEAEVELLKVLEVVAKAEAELLEVPEAVAEVEVELHQIKLRKIKI